MLATLMLATSLALASAGPAQARPVPNDSAAVVRALDAFHDALASGDSTAALDLLAEDAMILEGGSVQTRAEYRAHHLSADIRFAGMVTRERGPIAVTVRGEIAWAVSTSTTRGEVRGRAVDSRGTELAVLVRAVDGWKITAIHWSSRRQR